MLINKFIVLLYLTGYVDHEDGLTFNSQANYECDPGFKLEGQTIRTCKGRMNSVNSEKIINVMRFV